MVDRWRECGGHDKRAGGSNPKSLRGKTLDCFVARAPRNDGARGTAVVLQLTPVEPGDDSKCVVSARPNLVIASAAKQSSTPPRQDSGLLRRKSSSQ
ncbi:hypothetical protein EAS62_11205 [Bradyrhizobium zhanjiangense]|uniref:Uncharacterized protein n=1 Tax=Bradyrhizobium zhanjiangense TaxID=1325107 RepID=A0ABY0DMJ7_9BRAD|nr:hypothetical protein EAS62_11205 [Bradyrhizobium zhanjiangense]